MDYFDWGDYATAPFDPAVPTDWASGQFDLTGDTGNPVGPGSTFDVGPGQIPSDVYQQLLSIGGLGPGMSTSIPGAGSAGVGGAGGVAGGSSGGIPLSSLANLIPLLAPILGGMYAANRTNKANDQIQQAIQQANGQITGILGGNQGLFQPYRDAGMVGLNRLTSMPQSTLSSRYRPLGTGAGMSLGSLAGGK